jgi:hypothetical protein
MEPILLDIKGQQVSVSELPFKRYTELLSAFQELPNYISKIQGRSGEEILRELPSIVPNCYSDAVRVIKLVSNLDEEKIGLLGLYDIVQILTAAYEVNRFSEIISGTKKMTAQPTQI